MLSEEFCDLLGAKSFADIKAREGLHNPRANPLPIRVNS